MSPETKRHLVLVTPDDEPSLAAFTAAEYLQ